MVVGASCGADSAGASSGSDSAGAAGLVSHAFNAGADHVSNSAVVNAAAFSVGQLANTWLYITVKPSHAVSSNTEGGLACDISIRSFPIAESHASTFGAATNLNVRNPASKVIVAVVRTNTAPG